MDGESVELFNRQYSLQISTSKKKIDLSNLHSVFNTTAYVSGTPKTLRIRIYNLNPQTILPVQEEGGQIILQAGYEGQYGIIFSGQIIQIRSGRENGVDTFCDITATDGDAYFTQGFISTAVDSSQTSLTNRMFHVVKNTQTPQPMTLQESDIMVDTSKVTNVTLPRGRSYFGMSKDHLRRLSKSVGALYEIENNTQVSILAVNRGKQKAIPQINYKTGLIGSPTQTIEGIQFKMLLNPYIVQGMLVKLDSVSILMKEIEIKSPGTRPNENTQIQQKSTDGIYKVLYCTHVGDTRGQNWYTEVVCYTDAFITQPATAKKLASEPKPEQV